MKRFSENLMYRLTLVALCLICAVFPKVATAASTHGITLRTDCGATEIVVTPALNAHCLFHHKENGAETIHPAFNLTAAPKASYVFARPSDAVTPPRDTRLLPAPMETTLFTGPFMTEPSDFSLTAPLRHAARPILRKPGADQPVEMLTWQIAGRYQGQLLQKCCDLQPGGITAAARLARVSASMIITLCTLLGLILLCASFSRHSLRRPRRWSARRRARRARRLARPLILTHQQAVCLALT